MHKTQRLIESFGVIVIVFNSTQSDPIKRRTLYRFIIRNNVNIYRFQPRASIRWPRVSISINQPLDKYFLRTNLNLDVKIRG